MSAALIIRQHNKMGILLGKSNHLVNAQGAAFAHLYEHH